MVRLSKKTRDRSVSPRRPKALLAKVKREEKENTKKKDTPEFRKHENAIGEEKVSSRFFIPRIK